MFRQAIDSLEKRIPKPDSTYVGDDGLLRCSVCHRKVQAVIQIFGETRTVPCVCDCQRAEQKRFEENQRQQEIERNKRICFAETNMASWTFDNDDRQNPKISDAMKRYADGFAEFRKQGKGLLLSGTFGTGKTYLAACIANELIDKGYSCRMANFPTLTNTLQGMFDGKQEFIRELTNYDLLVLDDLGAERKTEYMQETMFNIIDSLYRAGTPLIITTNLTFDEIKKPQNREYARIYDRIIERCFPIELNGLSRRRQNVKDTYADMKNALGL